jgi:outer membrane protein OmpU
MTKLRKIGLTALAGSLAAVTAQAGEMAVSGSAIITYTQGKTANSSKNFGTDQDVAFSGSGELDNGYTFSVTTTLTDAYAVSSNNTNITMGSLGTVTFGTGHTAVNGLYDEETPQAYEQTSDAFANSSNSLGAWDDDNSISYNSPAIDMGGATINIDAAYSWNADGNGTNDGGTATNDESYGSGNSLGVRISYDALTIGAYGAERKNVEAITAGSDAVRDDFGGTWFAKYSFGPVSVGYQTSYLDEGLAAASTAATAAKAVGTAGGFFEAEHMSIAFNVNDDLSISYSETKDTYDAQSNVVGGTEIADVEQDTSAIQIAYSMGAMSVKAYQMEQDNPGYDNNAASSKATEIAIGLAF